MRAGVIGTAGQASAVAQRLHAAGRLQALDPAGSAVRSDWPEMASDAPTVIAACDVVFLDDPDAFLRLLAGRTSSIPPLRTMILLGSASDDQLVEIAQAAEAHRVALADCSLIGTEDGDAVLIGGAIDTVCAIRPVLEGLGSTIVHAGELGAAGALQAAFTVLCAGRMRAAHESAALAAAAGVLPEAARRIAALAGSGDAPWATAANPDHRADALRAQIGEALARATRLGVALPVAQLAAASAAQMLGTAIDPPAGASPVERGLAVFEQVYGPGSSGSLVGSDRSDFALETVSHLFGEIWSRPNLSIRDRRLLLIGVTATLGREDLILVQARAALVNDEMTEAQLDEMVLFLAFYVGWCNSGPIHSGVIKAKRERREAGVGDR